MSGAGSVSLLLENEESGAQDAPGQSVGAELRPVPLSADADAPFASFVNAHRGPGGKALGRQGALMTAVALAHLAAFALVAQHQFVKPTKAAPLRLTFTSPRALVASLPRPASSPAAAAAPTAASPARRPHAQHPPARLHAPAVAPAPNEPVPSTPEAPLASEGPAQTADTAPGATTALTNSAPGVPALTAAPAAVAARALDPDERRRLLQRYLHEMMGSRINQKRFYPAEAEEAGLQARVIVRVIVDGAGKLLSATVVEGEEVPMLARAAITTINAAQPFPPPPAILGNRVQVDVTLNYTLP